ncbi:MAG: Stp1/IreP family PP2C-type Ser/Thr phosphatase [Clostridia bacterium]
MLCVGKTDVGRKRKNNQDSFKIYSSRQYTAAVVCDGMGGAKGGSVASSLASGTFMKSLKSALAKINFETITSGDLERILINAFDDANRAVFDRASMDTDLEGMGTTFVAFVCTEAETMVINVGDSRLYAIVNGKMNQITKDHSFVQYLIDNEQITIEQAKNHPNKNIILRAVGVNDYVECDVFRLKNYDMLLLCTDGLTNMVDDQKIESILANDGNFNTKENILLDIANENGGVDNITVVIFCRKDCINE